MAGQAPLNYNGRVVISLPGVGPVNEVVIDFQSQVNISIDGNRINVAQNVAHNGDAAKKAARAPDAPEPAVQLGPPAQAQAAQAPAHAVHALAQAAQGPVQAAQLPAQVAQAAPAAVGAVQFANDDLVDVVVAVGVTKDNKGLVGNPCPCTLPHYSKLAINRGAMVHGKCLGYRKGNESTPCKNKGHMDGDLCFTHAAQLGTGNGYGRIHKCALPLCGTMVAYHGGMCHDHKNSV